MSKVLITTVPFADNNQLPITMLNEAGIEYVINPIGRKLTEDELAELITGYDVLIAGTEPITDKVMDRATCLKLISRVGVGLDSVDLNAARSRGIQVSYTAEAPAPAVAELTLGLMLNLLRHVHLANGQMHQSQWRRYFGKRLAEVTVGIIGAGRIGGRVLHHLRSFSPQRVLVNDLRPIVGPLGDGLNVEWVDKETIYREADVISLHVPLTAETKNMIGMEQLRLMKPGVLLVNTARGGIINERDLAAALRAGLVEGAAVDVFEQEPYAGELAEVDRCLLTSHMGSMSIDCRAQMEIEATAEAVRLLTGRPLTGLVPEDEYEVQQRRG